MEEQKGGTDSAWGVGRIMYTHVSKCENDKIKFLKNNMRLSLFCVANAFLDYSFLHEKI
jgi:hypothetical protein